MDFPRIWHSAFFVVEKVLGSCCYIATELIYYVIREAGVCCEKSVWTLIEIESTNILRFGFLYFSCSLALLFYLEFFFHFIIFQIIFPDTATAMLGARESFVLSKDSHKPDGGGSVYWNGYYNKNFSLFFFSFFLVESDCKV